MKKVKIDWNGNYNPTISLYESEIVRFSWLAPGKTKSEFSQVTGWHSCRETFTGEICKFVSLKVPHIWTPKRDLDFKKTQVAVVRRHKKTDFVKNTKSDLKWMRCSARMLNVFEKSQGWSLTHVGMCDDPNIENDSINVFTFNSSPKWMHAPQLLSIYLLIIRLGRFYEEFSKFKSVDDLENMYKIFSKDRDKRTMTDPAWFIETWKYWMLVLNNHNILFFGKSLKENYRSNNGESGIKYLIRGCADKDILKVWKEILPKELQQS
jgi:hypothetical protein